MKSKSINTKQSLKGNQKTSLEKSIEVKWWNDSKILLMLLAVLAITAFVMSPSLKAIFVNWDDDANVYENINVTTFNISNIFSSHILGNYNPLTTLTFAIEYHFFKDNPFHYHLDNFLLHLINTFLVFILISQLGMKKQWALLVALLFGIHPMHIESVAWVTERKDVLYGMFYLLAANCYLQHYKTKKSLYLLLTYLFFILSLLSKIQAVALPLSLLLFDYLNNRPLKINLIIEKIPYFIFSLLIGFLGIHFLKEQGSINPVYFSIIEKILIGIYSICIYLIKSVVPYEMSTLYPYPLSGDFEWYYYLTPFILLILGYIIFRTLKYTRSIVFGFLFFLFNVMFVLQVVSAGQGFIADRFTYIPYIGIFYVFAFLLNRFYEQTKSFKTIVVSFSLIISLIYATVAYSHIAVWKNTATLFTYVLNHYKNVPTAYWNRGNYFRDNKIYDKAIIDYSELLRIKPNDGKAYVSRGKLYFDTKEYDKAFEDFNSGLKYDSEDKDGYSNRAGIYTMRKQYDLALKDMNKAWSIDPKIKDGLKNRSLIYFNQNEYEKTIKDLDAYLLTVPDEAEVYDMRAICKLRLNRFAEALEDSNKAISLKQDIGSFYENRAFENWRLGNKQAVNEDLKKAQQLGSKLSIEYLEKLPIK